MTLDWRGDEVQRRVAAASAAAINEVMTDAAHEAALHWPRRTGLSADSIEVLEPARPTRDGAEGAWGGRTLPPGDYDPSSRHRVLFTEIGFRGRSGLHILRRTADAHYGRLAGRIRGKLR